MTCGICDPTRMAEEHGANNAARIVVGYAVPLLGSAVEKEVARMYLLGASLVFWDDCLPMGHAMSRRPKLKRLIEFLRPGDVLIINSEKAAGDRPTRRAKFISKLEEIGISVRPAREPAQMDLESLRQVRAQG